MPSRGINLLSSLAYPAIMSKKPKKKLTAQQRQRRKEFMVIFVNGKQKKVKRVPSAKEEAELEEFYRNADPIWLLQNEMWEYLP